MAQDQAIVARPPEDWTQLTNADATAISFQVLTGAANTVRVTLTT